jgi:hypothetical protein
LEGSALKSAQQVQTVIEQVKQEMKQGSISASMACWKAALACVGWAYVYGAYGEYCEPSNRRSRYRDSHPTIKSKCKNFSGKDSVPAGCVGCQWYLGTADSDQSKHEGRTRFFDCRGYVYWILHQVCGMWEKCPAGCTTMWNTESNWKAKGEVSKGVPEDVLVCLFKQDPKNSKKMAHIGFGYHGETLECSSGVEYSTSRDKKWTHWAVPVCIDGSIDPGMPTLRRGDKGEYVTLAQTALVQHGYDIGKCGIDGSFGAATEKAVRLFQTDNGLVSDGIIGQKTWDALLASSPVLYTVTIPHLTASTADALCKQYAEAVKTEEGR